MSEKLRAENLLIKNLRVLASLRLTFILIVLSFPVAAQTISGIVTDTNNAPMQNAIISVSWQNRIIAQTKSGAIGKFLLEIKDTNALLKVLASGFSDFEETFYKKLEIFTAIENVFNNRYDIGRTPVLTIAAPRFVRVGLRFALNEK